MAYDPQMDEDSDPRGGSQTRRRAAEAEGALADESQGAWRVILLIAAILGGAISLIIVDRYLGVAWAQGVTAPLEKRVDALEYERAESRARQAHISRQLVAICRASARPEVCLTDN